MDDADAAGNRPFIRVCRSGPCDHGARSGGV